MASNGRSDQHYDDTLRDDTSIEILSNEGEDSHMRGSQWSIYSASSDSVEFQKLNIHSKMVIIVHHDGRQFIERRDLDDGGLPYSAEFYLGDELWKLSGEDCFLMSSRRYIARVSVEGTVDLDGTVDFEDAVRTLLKQLKVVEVLFDEQRDECNKAKSALAIVLDKLGDGLGVNIDYKRDVILLRSLLQKHGNSLNMDFKHDLQSCSRLSSEMMSTFGNFVAKALKLIQRNEILGHLNDSSLSNEFIHDAIKETLNIHRVQLSAACPSTMKDKLKELAEDHILYVALADMNLFNDLKIFGQPLFDSVLPMIFSKFLTRVQEITAEQLIDLEPMSNRIYLYVCKSLQEVAEQLGTFTENDNVIIYSEAHGWEVTIGQEEPLSLYSKCLRQQLQILAKLANHFEPGGPFRTSQFPYEFKLFQKMEAVSEAVRIWLCILDNCMKDLVQADIQEMEMLSCFFKSYVSFITAKEFHGEILECLRTITHEALRSLVGMEKSSQHDRTTSDAGLVEFNDMISRCFDKFLREHFEKDCEQIQVSLRRIIGQAMNMSVTSEELTEFSCVFKQLLKDIRELPIEWYLQLPPSENRNLLLRGQFVIPVDNSWKDTVHECLKVVNSEGFVKMYKLLYNGEEIPKQYQLKAIQEMLDELAAKHSCYEGKLHSDKHHLDDLTNMINSFRNLILFLNRQPEYSSFESFLQDIGKLFSHEIKQRRMEDDRISMSTTNGSAETDPTNRETIDPLSDLFESSISKGQLTNGLRKYSTQFNKHITETVQLPREKRIEQIASEVLLIVKPQLATNWTEEFKRNELPNVLAGLSAVWSLIVSKNGSCAEKLVKPSNLQICYILSCFGSQNLKDDDLNRLLYISTQHGKELVLGLTAALLALYGHKVMIACYNSNLARRNSIDMIELFKVFSVQHSISFGSMEDMAREQSREIYEKYATHTHRCLGLEVKANDRSKHTYEDGRSVLLIDDIDLLLQNKTLGETFKRYVTPTIPGLAQLQEKMICQNVQLTKSEIERFILRSDDPQIGKLRAFLDREQSYSVLEGNQFDEKQCTNKTLLDRHLYEIERYTKYPQYPCDDLRLSSDGVVTVQSSNKNNALDVRAELSYFRLKRSDFQQTVNSHKNYGYLKLGHIPVPYAHLLKTYPLILAFVSTSLNGYEELTLNDQYGLYHKIAKSNPFPTESTKFDFKQDFILFPHHERSERLFAIMVAINGAIDRNCSVLVFFKSELQMEEFQNEFALLLKRLSVTPIKTASNRENLSEDELAVDEVAVLVIEAVGRNKDCSKLRQLHVIQTFFSVDRKEEDLIRKQAERSHGSGSYELIVSDENLRWAPVSSDKYDSLYEWYTEGRRSKSSVEARKCLTKNMADYLKIEKFCEKFKA